MGNPINHHRIPWTIPLVLPISPRLVITGDVCGNGAEGVKETELHGPNLGEGIFSTFGEGFSEKFRDFWMGLRF